ncbi:tRNA N(3)-methylcytidine methyltransferase Mettl2 [Macrosteles quadrilineatus]|uniref:tRNA N(3)-methylcytidine methyltransferase Mettl2 n=1 Tax=Macrosteles quadrilineatus TaxID=74068 RepID=UPI0023E1EBEF|nr:tRNA N(3)-methylcytidine methyltransferase Mettl2 [Macrosteles quadrilineatus]
MSEDTEIKRPQFGARQLKDGESALKHNCWDNVEWEPELLEAAQEKIKKQSEKRIPDEAKEHLQRDTGNRWDKFYGYHQNRFFKDRHWLFTEFPELAGTPKPETPERVFPANSGKLSEESSVSKDSEVECQPESSAKESENVTKDSESEHVPNYVKCENDNKSKVEEQSVETGVESLTLQNKKEEVTDKTEKSQRLILEIGCGVGNTIFPILEYNIDPNIFIYGCDFSTNAIDILKSNPEYDSKRCHAFVCDITADDWKAPFPKNSLDTSTLIFVLSAIHPQKMSHVIRQLYDHMRPGGLVLFRDYGRYDMAQLRFKPGQMMEDNFYVRSDGTFVYFFTQEEVTKLFTEAGFQEEMIYTDRRMQVNRLRQLKMYRVWVQAKYRKPLES